MVGIELHGGASRTLAVMRALLTRGYLVLTGGVAGDVLTLTPALDIEESLLLGFAEVLEQVLVACPC
jgi:4-aminobutyrate aminotransferase/(S)-3-amino-2-methylpropionate transaminase